jgi:hypothetical protein
MTMGTVKQAATYYANIWLGTRAGYDGDLFSIQKIWDICQEYVEKGLCVTVTPTHFIYTGGEEPGVCIGLINYPRFPSPPQEILDDAVALAEILMKEMKQFRCTIVTPQETFLLENEDKIGSS